MTFTFREIGADNFVLSNKPESMAVAAKSLDLILNTVSADHDLTALIGHDIPTVWCAPVLILKMAKTSSSSSSSSYSFS